MQNLVNAGIVAGTHHLKGAVKIVLDFDIANLLVGEKIILQDKKGLQKVYTVKKMGKFNGVHYIAEFEEINSKEEASKIAGNDIIIRRDLLNLDEDEYLIEDLIGLVAIDRDTEETLGKVTKVLDSTAHEILVIEDEKYETMVPNIDVFVSDIDFETGHIFINLIDGLREEKNKKSIQDDGLDEDNEN